MEIAPLQEVGSQINSKESNLAQTLGKDDFLSLLVTQLKNQDPLKPTDPAEFTGQLAQFSSLEQLQNIYESMQAFQSIDGSIDRLSALSLIDRHVTTKTDKIRYEGAPLDIGFSFEDHVKEATIFLRNEAGQTITKIIVDQPSNGENFVDWDWTDENDLPIPKGDYTLDVIGVTLEDEILAGDSLIRNQITGVDFSGAESVLLTAGGKVKLSEIVKVNSSTPKNQIIEK